MQVTFPAPVPQEFASSPENASGELSLHCYSRVESVRSKETEEMRRETGDFGRDAT